MKSHYHNIQYYKYNQIIRVPGQQDIGYINLHYQYRIYTNSKINNKDIHQNNTLLYNQSYTIMSYSYNINIFHLLDSLYNYLMFDLSMLNIENHIINKDIHQNNTLLYNQSYKIMSYLYNINIFHLLDSFYNYLMLDQSMLNNENHIINIHNYWYNILLNSQSYKIMSLMYNINKFHLYNNLYNYISLNMSNIMNYKLKLFSINYFILITLTIRIRSFIITIIALASLVSFIQAYKTTSLTICAPLQATGKA